MSKKSKRPHGLKIAAKGKAKLSKQQQTFNQLTNRIAKLEKLLANKTAMMSNLLQYYNLHVAPILRQMAGQRFLMAELLDNATQRYRYSEEQKAKMGRAIVILLEFGFKDLEANEGQIALYNKWSNVPYDVQMEQQAEDMKQSVSDFFKDMFDVDLDLNDLDMDSPESQAEFKKKLDEMFEGSSKKSEKKLEYERTQNEESIAQLKNIRGIYITLAKVLHPDTATTDHEKQKKHQLMQQVTRAYKDKDLPALIKLEMEWVHQTADNLNGLADDKLKLYINALREQVDALEHDIESLGYNPLYASISSLVDGNELAGRKAIDEIAKESVFVSQQYDADLLALSNKGAKGSITNLVEAIVEMDELVNASYMFDDEFMDDEFMDDEESDYVW